MKKLILFLILILGISIFSMAQVTNQETTLPTGYDNTKLDSIVRYITPIEIDSSRINRTSYNYYTDNIPGKDTLTTLAKWNENSSGYQLISESHKTYNQIDQYIEGYLTEWTNDGTIKYAYNKEYDEEGKPVLFLTSHNLNGDTILIEIDKQEYEYENDLLKNRLLYSNNEVPVNWDYYSQIEYIYNEDNYLITKYRNYEIDQLLSNYHRYYYSYDTMNLINLYTEVFDAPDQIDIQRHKREYSYDLKCNITEIIFYKKDTHDQAWQEKEQIIYEYEASMLNLCYVNDWDESTEEWKPDSLYLYQYNEDKLIQKIIRKSWNKTSQTWISESMDCYYYSELNVSNSEDAPKTSHINIYPNPSQGMFKLSESYDTQSEIVIYNSSGQMVRTVQLSPYQRKVNLSDLNNGIYYITIRNDQDLKKTKLVIQK